MARILKFPASLGHVAFAAFLAFVPVAAHGAHITWDTWTLGTASVSASSYAAASGTATPNTLAATAAAAVVPYNPASFFSENATASIQLSNFFHVVADDPAEDGKEVKGHLIGHLTGALGATGIDIFSLTGSYNASVEANVNAGFAQWSNPAGGHSVSGSVLVIDANSTKVNDIINVPGLVTVGSTYAFSMSLTVSASKSGAYQAISKFDNNFFADVQVENVPEPSASLLLGTGMLISLMYSRRKTACCNCVLG